MLKQPTASYRHTKPEIYYASGPWQDVVCKYWPWFSTIPKELSPPAAFDMKPALSIMHGKLIYGLVR
jgi:hypothetical protein